MNCGSVRVEFWGDLERPLNAELRSSQITLRSWVGDLSLALLSLLHLA